MWRGRWDRLAIVIPLIVAAAAVVAFPLISSNRSEAQQRGVVGSWLFVPTGAPGRAPGTPSLVTFTSDGTVLWSGPSGSSSGGHGVWARTGDHSVTETFIFSRHNATGAFIGTQKVRLNLTADATFSEISGSGKTDIFDAQGAVTQSADITTRATRITVESP